MFARKMQHTYIARPGVVAAVCLALGIALCAPTIAQVVKGPTPKDKSAPPKAYLVYADEEYADELHEVEKMIADSEDLALAIQILQAMINRNDSCFVATDDPAHFVGLRVKANEILGTLPPEGLKLYREMYDAEAQVYYNEALAGNTARLRLLVDRYPHTSFGPAGLELMAAMYFDRGRFAQAAICWQQLLNAHPSEDDIPLIVAKLATAHHLSGDSVTAQKDIKKLRDRYPRTNGMLSGENRNLVEFVTAAMKIAPDIQGAGQGIIRPKRVWPGLGGIPDGAANMSDCDALLVGRWSMTANEEAGIKDRNDLKIPSDLLALQESFNNAQILAQQNLKVRVHAGQVQLRSMAPGRMNSMNLAPAIQPVIVDDQVIYRTSQGIVACNIITGEVIWKMGNFPIERSININQGYYGYNQYLTVEDLGRYLMTAGGDKLYVLGNYRQYMHPNTVNQLQNQPGMKEKLIDSSTLAAVSIKSQGALRWKVGNGSGDDEITRNGKMLSAPTYSSGRLYAVMAYLESYHVVCLDADTGKLLWKSQISQSPSANAANIMNGQPSVADRAGPVAVSDGRVFTSTNTGVIGAFEADTGQPLWAYQYDSNPANRGNYGQPNFSDRSVNPVLAVGGKVIAMPTDSNDIYCLSPQDGSVAWSSPLSRNEQRDLSYIDDTRFLISGSGLYVLKIDDGKVLFGQPNKGITGRPAVSDRAVLASGEGMLCRLDLKNYTFSTIDLISPEAVLGNLVCVDGMLVASNAAGICAYFNYDQAYKKMSERIAGAGSPQEKLQLTFQRAQVAFSAKRISSALQDLLDCYKMAQEQKDDDMVQNLPPRLYRAYVAMANESANPKDMLDYIKKSGQYARSDQEKALNLLRMAKCYAKAGDLEQALAQAQEISDKMPEELLADVPIGPESDPTVRQDIPANRTARAVAQDLIGEILAKPKGREAYKKFDDLAKAEMEKSRAKRDAAAMVTVAQSWPHSLYAPEARFSAGEEYYQQSQKLNGDEKSAATGNAMKCLSIVSNDTSKFRAPARLAMALIYIRSNSLAMAQLSLNQLEGIDPAAAFSFADFHGKVADVLKQVPADKTPPQVPDVAALKGIPDQLYSIAGQNVTIMTDQDYHPVRLGDQVLVLKDDRLVLVDTLAGDADNAVAWSALSTVRAQPNAGNPWVRQPKQVIAGLTKDKKIICVVDPDTACGLDVRSAKIVWRHAMTEYGARPGLMSIGEGMLVFTDQAGKVSCVDLSTGELAWSSEPASTMRGMIAPPTIARWPDHDGMVLAKCNAGKSLVCWNLKNGKMLTAIEGKTSAKGEFNPRGVLVTLVDEKLSVREPGNLQKPVWERAYPGAQADIGCVLADTVLMSPSRGSNQLELISLVSGAVIQKFFLGSIGNAATMPLTVDVQGDSLYVTCTKANQPANPQVFNGMVNNPGGVRGVSVQKFNLKTGKKEWQSDIDGEGGTTYLVPALVVGKTHVMFAPGAMVKESGEIGDAKLYVIDASDGRLVSTIDPMKTKGDQIGRTGQRSATPAVMTNGRIILENVEGVTVYGGN